MSTAGSPGLGAASTRSRLKALPRSRGGHTTWINVVTACSACNLRKANLTPPEAKMWPSQMPFQPTVQHLHRNGRAFPPNYLHESWLDYLYWDTELEP